MAKRYIENVEIISSASGQSGLKLTNLPTGPLFGTGTSLLAINNVTGEVVKADPTTIATITVGPTPPASPVTGQQWLDTSVTPSELKIWNGTSWQPANDEVQHYPNFASFPPTGVEGVVYIDDATDTAYLWDTTTSTYVSAVGGPSGLFSITDGTTTEAIGVGNTITFTESAAIANVLDLEVLATDTVRLRPVAGHTNGQALVSNGTVFNYQSVGRKHAETITPVANTAYTITHNLGTTDIIVQAYDVTLNELVSVEVVNRTAASVDIISTTTDQLRIVVLG